MMLFSFPSEDFIINNRVGCRIVASFIADRNLNSVIALCKMTKPYFSLTYSHQNSVFAASIFLTWDSTLEVMVK